MAAEHSKAEPALGYSFQDSGLLTRALTHSSAGADNNERLEHLGDAVLDLLIAEELYYRFPKASEGELTRFRSAMVRGKSLASIAAELGLGNFLVLSKGEWNSGGQHRESTLADALEAVLGAVYLDGGLEACRQRVKDWFGELLENATLAVDAKDPKTRLQEYLQGRKLPLPIYKIIAQDGPVHQQTLTLSCSHQRLAEATIGVGSNRKKAEQQAAELALQYFQKHESKK